jgi:tetratricopeptide (TPR) repeat protein
MKSLLLCGALVLAAFAPVAAIAQPPSAHPEPEAVSLFGEPLRPTPLSKEALADRAARLAEARAAVAARPGDPEALIWLGRRIAYLGRYRESIEIFSRGIALFPEDARFYRHRGHRYLTLRKFDLAAADLEKGTRLVAGKPDEVEPDGLPNARNIPTSTLQSNLWYHLGLAYYLQGDFEKALTAYRECLKVSKNPDMLVATSHWLYMTLRRLGHAADSDEARAVLAPIRADLEILENQAYHRLLLMYRGEVKPEALLAPASGADAIDPVTAGYGVGNWHLYNGRKDEAVKVLRSVLAQGQWAAFGHIAAEADLHRLGEKPEKPAGPTSSARP